MSHTGNILGGTPEHLRHATDPEKSAYDVMHHTVNTSRDLRQGRVKQYQIPNPEERESVDGA